eukprot:6180904-Pleurochrysis_carterae.AAC.2
MAVARQQRLGRLHSRSSFDQSCLHGRHRRPLQPSERTADRTIGAVHTGAGALATPFAPELASATSSATAWWLTLRRMKRPPPLAEDLRMARPEALSTAELWVAALLKYAHVGLRYEAVLRASVRFDPVQQWRLLRVNAVERAMHGRRQGFVRGRSEHRVELDEQLQGRQRRAQRHCWRRSPRFGRRAVRRKPRWLLEWLQPLRLLRARVSLDRVSDERCLHAIANGGSRSDDSRREGALDCMTIRCIR